MVGVSADLKAALTVARKADRSVGCLVGLTADERDVEWVDTWAVSSVVSTADTMEMKGVGGWVWQMAGQTVDLMVDPLVAHLGLPMVDLWDSRPVETKAGSSAQASVAMSAGMTDSLSVEPTAGLMAALTAAPTDV